MTVADKIRSMNDEELAKCLCKFVREGLCAIFPNAYYSEKDIEELDRDWFAAIRQEYNE